MQTTTNYVFVTFDDATNAIVLRINSAYDVICNSTNDIIAAFKQFNINKYDTIMCSSDLEFATEFNYAYDSAAHDMLDDALIACNI